MVGLVDGGRLFIDLIESSKSAVAMGERCVIVAFVTYLLFYEGFDRWS